MDEFLKFMHNNRDYIMTATTMIIGIFAGWLPNLKKKASQIIITIILAIIFAIITWISYDNLIITYIAIGCSVAWFISSLFVFFYKKEVVSRKRLDRMLRKFTDDADREQPLCIFGGDLDFFGDYVKPTENSSKTKPWWHSLIFWEKRKKIKNDISKNKQFIQIKNDKNNDCFREIQILSIRPNANNDKHKRARIRLGYLKEELGESLKVKFFTDKKDCSKCSQAITCYACDMCNACSNRESCTHKVTHCEKLQKKCINSCFNPDMKLRGRFIQKKKNDSRSAAIVTTNEPGKSYILKEYNNITKEYSIYQKIWDIWWLKCEEDSGFIDQCVQEYTQYKNS